jgi:hypothetical protein
MNRDFCGRTVVRFETRLKRERMRPALEQRPMFTPRPAVLLFSGEFSVARRDWRRV